MHWIIIFGSRGRIVKASPEDILLSACPSCGGDLVLSHLKKYFHLFFISLFPTSTIDTFYECRRCKQKIRPGIKETFIPFLATQAARQRGDQRNFNGSWTSRPFFCSLCGKKHPTGTPRMHCQTCVRSICVDQYSAMLKTGRKGVCPDCDSELEPLD